MANFNVSPREYARKIVTKWPAPTNEQRERLRTILAPVVNRLTVSGAA